MKYFLYLFLIILIATSSCRKDFDTIPSFGKLEFSKDTVFLDTIFTNIGSSTYNLKVYNRGSNSITIPNIQLEKNIYSNYRLNVDGIPGKEFTDIDILGKDSIFIFIETTTDVGNNLNLLYTDKILFDNGDTQQDVDLVTLVQDANFIYPERNAIDSLTLGGQPTTLKGRFLTEEELLFTNTKPTVIYGYAAVPENKILTIEAGANVYFHDNSGLIIDYGATLKVNGTLSEKVTFEGDRLERSFSDIAGQWGAIWMRAGSKNNEITHAIIKNGTIGILVDSIGTSVTPTLKLKNTEIYNHANFGILAKGTNIEAHNVVVGTAGQASLAATEGGTYNFTHSTFANFWNSSFRQFPAVFVNNLFTYTNDMGQETFETRDLHAANFTNCIFEGNKNTEFALNEVDGDGLFNYTIRNSMIKSSEVFENNANYENIIKNGNAAFKNTQNNDFSIGEESDAINKAKLIPLSTAILGVDILGIDRTTNPDIGAYQHTIFK